MPSTSATQSIENVNKVIADAYNEQQYESHAFTYSSPRHLRGAAHFYGLETVPLECARVLELGCAAGGNLLPFAVAYPQAHLVGVDLSAVQIQQGQQLVKELGLKNLDLQALSLMDITSGFGQFDYIIAHGVFSWVPVEVREAMLRIVHENLSPNGVAYISYNTYPGWKASDIVRDAMLLHKQVASNGAAAFGDVKKILDLFIDGSAGNHLLAPALKNAAQRVLAHSDYYVRHEYLEIINNPCYLLEFVELAKRYAVTHVGDADPYVEMAMVYGENVRQNHEDIAQNQPRELRQQYLDFAVGRSFRKSLLIHEKRSESVLDSPEQSNVVDMRWAAYYLPVESSEDIPAGYVRFENVGDRYITTKNKATIGLINAVTEAWPASLDIFQILGKVRPALPEQTEDEAFKAILAALQELFRSGHFHYTLEAGPYDGYEYKQAQLKPKLIPGAAQILKARKENKQFGIGLFNLWHAAVSIHLQDAEYHLIPYMNGERTRTELRGILRDALHKGNVPDTNGQWLKGQRNLDSRADVILQGLLDLLHRNGLLC